MYDSVKIYSDDIYEEVDIDVMISMIPTTHPDRICFRKQRINKLLDNDIN